MEMGEAMLLKRLVEYSERLEPQPALYAEIAVRYIVELDSRGCPLSPKPVDTSDPATLRARDGQRRLMPQIQRSSGIKPILFADRAKYTLGITSGSPKREDVKHDEGVRRRHRAYLEMFGRCAEHTRLPQVHAVRRFLENAPLAKLELGEDFVPADRLTFRVDGVFPSDLKPVQRFWADEHDPANSDGKEVQKMQCLVCGETRPVLKRHQMKIKGVPGGQTSGTMIISANAEAFESYGLEASLIAPTCARCGERFTRAANDLLQKEANHFVIDRERGPVFIFWTREPCEFSFRDFLAAPQPEQVRALIESVRSGQNTAAFEANSFYAAALSASGGRVVIRDWIDNTVEQVRANLALWFERQSIIGPCGEPPRPFGITGLARSTVRDLRDLAPAISRALMRSALTGAPLPFDLIYETARRNRAEQGVTHPRAALTKLVMRSQRYRDTTEDTMVSLNAEEQSPAYRCGRLLAVLEQAQRLAIRPKATIVDRFYGAASSSPRLVYPNLLKLARAHLSKLERDNPGARAAIEARIEEITSGIPSFPATLTLEEQGLFSLGYYHQRAHDRAQAKEARAARQAMAEPGNA
jgi:CRISPR-associated protein Csd1